MSIIITKHPQELKYRVHFDNVSSERLVEDFRIEPRDISFKLDIEEAYARRALAGWLERMRAVDNKLPYSSDSWLSVDLLSIIQAITEVFTPSQEYIPLQYRPTLDGTVVPIPTKLSPTKKKHFSRPLRQTSPPLHEDEH